MFRRQHAYLAERYDVCVEGIQDKKVHSAALELHGGVERVISGQ